jgi:hypothetical protein
LNSHIFLVPSEQTDRLLRISRRKAQKKKRKRTWREQEEMRKKTGKNVVEGENRTKKRCQDDTFAISVGKKNKNIKGN